MHTHRVNCSKRMSLDKVTPMSRSNTAQSYGSIAKTFHWLTALLVIIVNHLRVITNDMGYETSEQLARKFIFFQCIKPWVSRFSMSPLLVSFGPSANPNPTDCIPNAKPRLGSPNPTIGRSIARSSCPPHQLNSPCRNSAICGYKWAYCDVLDHLRQQVHWFLQTHQYRQN
jgi:hypothetical protein